MKKMSSGELSIYVRLFDIPLVGQKVVVMLTDKRLKQEGVRR